MNNETKKHLIVILEVIMIIFVGIVIFVNKRIAEKISSSYRTEFSEFKKKPLTEEIILENERKPVLIDHSFDPLAPVKPFILNRSPRRSFPKEKSGAVKEVSERNPILIQ